MKKTVVNLLAIGCLIISCNSNKALVNQKESANKHSAFVGHLKMGLIGYEIIDTANMSVDVAEMMMEMMKSSFETEHVFNSTRTVDLIKENDEYVRTSIYDRSTTTLYEFLTKDSIEYYSEENVSQVMEKINTPDEDLEELSKMFKVIPYSSSKTEIFGFKCEEIIVMQPPDFTEISANVFTTDKIPSISEAMGAMSKYFTGVSLKTIMSRSGLKITFGAIEFNENRSLERFLNIDTTKLQKLSQEELEAKKNN